ncbi:hypothetical protein [Natronorubrum sp. DTA28]|uniref:hypothetical protein n=1 Tax=Natronorubrum sp. DTA28 TaxID=3447019 RepID=UPI003F85013F
MRRYETTFSDGTFFLETGDDWIEVGTEEALLELLGETYSIEYSEKERASPWLETDDEGVLTVDVRETLSELTFRKEFVEQIADCELSATTEDGVPVRTAVFADMIQSIWEAKGNVDE